MKRGDIIKGPYWPSPVEVNLVEDRGGYIHIVGVTTDREKRHIDQLIPGDEIE